MSGLVAPRSNFHGPGAMKVGASGGMNRFGAFDLAGNVREWCSNRANDSDALHPGRRLGRARLSVQRSSMRARRSSARPNFEFRGVKCSTTTTVATTGELVAFEARDFRYETAGRRRCVRGVSHALRSYDKGDLAARIEASDDSSRTGAFEKVSFAAAYGARASASAHRLPAGTATPPYQAVVYFPDSGTLSQRSSAQINARPFDWVIEERSSPDLPDLQEHVRARRRGLTSDYPTMTNTYREHVIAWAKDVRRTVDYLESRPDIDREPDRVHGPELGRGDGADLRWPSSRASRRRSSSSAGSTSSGRSRRSKAINFAPRAKMPVLMLNGRFDFYLPEDGTQIPMFRLFGAAGRTRSAASSTTPATTSRARI